MAQQEAPPLPQDKQVRSLEALLDNEVVLVNQDMINNGENVTNNAARDNDVVNNSNDMDNATAVFPPLQNLPPRNREHRPNRQVQQSQSPAVVVQHNSIQNPQRTQTLPTYNPHCQVDPQITFRKQNLQEQNISSKNLLLFIKSDRFSTIAYQVSTNHTTKC